MERKFTTAGGVLRLSELSADPTSLIKQVWLDSQAGKLE